jgi:hypothetical protein
MFTTPVGVFAYALSGARRRTENAALRGLLTDNRSRRPIRPGRGRWGRASGLLTAMLVLFSSAADAHSWYPKDCCHDGDCHPVPCDELIETRNGIMWRGVVLFNDAQVKASQDQFCHVCAKKQTGTVLPYLPLCAFIAPSS